MIDDVDKQVISLIQGDLPVDPRPFDLLAKEIGITEEELVNRIRSLKEKGIIRRFGATLRHQEAGFSSNAMVAWIVPEDRIDDVGEIMAGFREVSHCYHRNPAEDWPYNLYTMVHANDEDACRGIAGEMSAKAQVQDYTLLFSRKELKKTSMEYFKEE